MTSKFNSKRKLSRMGKKVKKGKMGPNTEFITRSSALKRLQITLKDFRRLCILKGIYPRVPSKGLQGNDKVYYDIKDISYIAHEPLLNKFREFKSFMKKIRKAAGRNETGEARRKDLLKPKISLDHLVKERYPRFIDALRDLDDPLCMIHLFASMPSLGRITPEKTANCAKLVRYWQHYVAKCKVLNKVFVSVKGVYFQAEVMGEPVTWVAPHQFTQIVPKEVDVRVMLTFLEFYEVFMQFVMYKLYALQNMQYPPTIDQSLDGSGCFLMALKSEQTDAAEGAAQTAAAVATQADAKKNNTTNAATNGAANHTSAAQLATLPDLLKKLNSKTEEDNEEEDEFDEDEAGLGQLAAPLQEAFQKQVNNDGNNAKSTKNLNNEYNADEDDELDRQFGMGTAHPKRVFANLVFFINREVPLEWMQLCILSFGGKVAWDGPNSPLKATDPSITHQIVDRPMQGSSLVTREYIQPQWVFDSVNAGMALPVDKYRPGMKLPPHLSPFVDDAKVGYTPKYSDDLQKIKDQKAGKPAAAEESESEAESEEEESDAEDEEVQASKTAGSKKKGAAVATTAPASKNGNAKNGKKAAPVPVENSESSEQEESEAEEDEEEVEKRKVLKNFTGAQSAKKGPKGVVFQPKNKESTEDEEASDLAKTMMSKKTKRLYDRMQHGITQKRNAVETLQTKRKQIETSDGGDGKKENASARKKGRK